MNLPGKNLQPHFDLKRSETEAFIDLFHSVPVAVFPSGWEAMKDEKTDGLFVLDIERSSLVPRNEWGQPLESDPPIELTLSEAMQCFKTAALMDFTKNLALDLLKDGALAERPEDYYGWELDKTEVRFRNKQKLRSFLNCWPELCGHDTMTGVCGTRNQHYSHCGALFDIVVQFVMRGDDLEYAMGPDNFGQFSEALTLWRTKSNG